MSDALESAWQDEARAMFAVLDEAFGTTGYDPATRPPETVAEAFKSDAYGDAMSLALMRSAFRR